ncbi:MAG: 4Fe-4S binding protein [Verrucomicrobiota bacterium]|nr:4Fe-4S binding protein [Verrucomicrobiota bacterium]
MALVFFVGLTLSFVDFRGWMPTGWVHALAGWQFVPAAVLLSTGVLSLALVGMVLLTFLLGRVYCSTLCPLGVYQDIVARIADRFRPKKLLLRFAQPHSRIRYGFLGITLVGIAVGAAGFSLALLDPYSNYGRIASSLFRPLGILINNGVATVGNSMGTYAIYHVTPSWAPWAALLLPIIMLLIVTVMAATRGRLYCNTICPVGTFLGGIARFSLFRLEIKPTDCHKCAACIRHCKAQCIDLRAGQVDFSRCVGCMNCIDACDRQAMRLVFKGTKVQRHKGTKWADVRRQKEEGSNATPAQPANPQRRAFLTSSTTGLIGLTGSLLVPKALRAEPTNPSSGSTTLPASEVVCPPGAVSKVRFLDTCTSCQLCISICPTHVIEPAFLEYGVQGLMKPRLNFSRSFCNFECKRCTEVCPDGALLPLTLADKKLTSIGVAHLDQSLCIVEKNGTDCAACSEHCPTKAVDTIPFRDGLFLPKVDESLCIGCGACEYACPAKPKAIIVTGSSTHGRARIKVEQKAVNPTEGDDFPF